MTPTADTWRPLRFRDLLVGGVRNGIYKGKEHHGRGAKIVNMGELFAHPRLGNVPMRRLAVDDSEQERFGLESLDLLFARRSLVAEGAGKCAIVTEVNEPTVFESSIIRARPDQSKANSHFLFYFWNSPLGAHLLDTIRRQVAVAGITGKDLEQLEVPLPGKQEQDAVAAVLCTLDGKIEHNRKTSRALEGLARAMFKAWFVDFEPVHAKAAGATSFPGMPPEAFAALPTRFTSSPLGQVPEGWEAGTMGMVGIQRRDQIDPAEVNEATPYIGLEHMPRRDITLAEWGNAGAVGSSKFRFRTGDILFGKLRPYFHKVGPAPVEGVCSTDIVVMHPTAPEYAAWLLMLAASDEFVSHTDQTSAGTKMPRTNWKDMAAFPVAVPPEPIAAAFERTVRPMFDLIEAAIHESRKLAELRDYLLPKLLSGEVRMNASTGTSRASKQETP